MTSSSIGQLSNTLPPELAVQHTSVKYVSIIVNKITNLYNFQTEHSN